MMTKQLIVPVFPVTGKAEKEVDLEQYFKAKGTLHCTTKFTNYGKADGAKEYAENPVSDLTYVAAIESISLFQAWSELVKV